MIWKSKPFPNETLRRIRLLSQQLNVELQKTQDTTLAVYRAMAHFSEEDNYGSRV